jgi:hypothetical protein
MIGIIAGRCWRIVAIVLRLNATAVDLVVAMDE